MNSEGKEQGYIYSRLWINSYLKSIEKWNAETYKERTKLLTDRFLEVWKLPEIHVKKDSFAGEINIFDAEEPTGKSLEYARFFGRIIRKDESKLDYTTLFVYVVRKIYEIVPLELLEYFGEELSIKKESNNMIRPRSISDVYYIETNYGSKEIFRRIRLILSKFELEDELYVSFKAGN
jgi:hypothetical protein